MYDKLINFLVILRRKMTEIKLIKSFYVFGGSEMFLYSIVLVMSVMYFELYVMPGDDNW